MHLTSNEKNVGSNPTPGSTLKTYDDRLLERGCRAEPEGLEAQPIWRGRVVSEQEKRMEGNPAFEEV